MEDSAGRKDTLATMLGSNTLWEGDALLSVDNNLLRMSCCIGSVDRLRWGKKTLSKTLFPWLLAEDNPVISC